MKNNWYTGNIDNSNSLKIKKSNIQGLGVFAIEDIQAGIIIGAYAPDTPLLYHEPLNIEYTLQFELQFGKFNKKVFVNAENSKHFSKWINHAWNPHNNIIFTPNGLLRTIKNIPKNCELLADYGLGYWIFKDFQITNHQLLPLYTQYKLKLFMSIIRTHDYSLLSIYEKKLYNRYWNSKIGSV